jgi:hypothetical protein
MPLVLFVLVMTLLSTQAIAGGEYGKATLLCYKGELALRDLAIKMRDEVPHTMTLQTDLPQLATVSGLEDYQGHSFDGDYVVDTSFIGGLSAGISMDKSINEKLGAKISFYSYDEIAYPPLAIVLYFDLFDNDEKFEYPRRTIYSCGVQTKDSFWKAPEFYLK